MTPENSDMAFARSLTFAALTTYREHLPHQNTSTGNTPTRPMPPEIHLHRLQGPEAELARSTGILASTQTPEQACHLIGSLYTRTMPREARKSWGAYYTPPALAEHVLDLAAQAGVNWQTAMVLDPSAGASAFLLAAARRIADNTPGNPCEAARHIEHRLRGTEIDPFAAWLSSTLLDIFLGILTDGSMSKTPRNQARQIVLNRDFLAADEEMNASFDLVIGNPPFGQIALQENLRTKFTRSLFGRANLYGVFMDQAIRMAKPGGIIALITPTGFLAGRYFTALRRLLAEESPPIIMDFITDRRRVFTGTIQETVIVVLQKGLNPNRFRVQHSSPSPASTTEGAIKTSPVGSASLPPNPEDPWLIPRRTAQADLIDHINRAGTPLTCRLTDYGYQVNTGQLVWQRHKDQFTDSPGPGAYPVIRANAVGPGGAFHVRTGRATHSPYIKLGPEQDWLITRAPCILVQRTTSTEQARRILAAELPQEFLDEHQGGAVVENHLSIIRPKGANAANPEESTTPSIFMNALTAVLNSTVVDQIFRSINGTVAVSAYELNALPLPCPEALAGLETALKATAGTAALEQEISRLYTEHLQTAQIHHLQGEDP